MLAVAEFAALRCPRPRFHAHVFDLGYDDIDGLVGLNSLRELNYEVRSACHHGAHVSRAMRCFQCHAGEIPDQIDHGLFVRKRRLEFRPTDDTWLGQDDDVTGP